MYDITLHWKKRDKTRIDVLHSIYAKNKPVESLRNHNESLAKAMAVECIRDIVRRHKKGEEDRHDQIETARHAMLIPRRKPITIREQQPEQ